MGKVAGFTEQEEKALMIQSLEILERIVKTGEYLFHVTNEESFVKIMDSKTVLPLTVCHYRTASGFIPKGEREKGTSSFTEDPLSMLLEDIIGCFDNKNYVLVFKREALKKQGVTPVKYIRDYEMRTLYADYTYGFEEVECEREWRSLSSVSIKDAIVSAHVVPDRVYNPYNNGLKFNVEKG